MKPITSTSRPCTGWVGDGAFPWRRQAADLPLRRPFWADLIGSAGYLGHHLGGWMVGGIFIFIIFLAIILVPMGYFGVARERSGLRLGRGRYAMIFLGCLFGFMIVATVIDMMHLKIGNSLSFAWIVIEFRLLRLSVQRLRDMGRGRNFAYLCLIPWLGLLAHLWLCFPRSRGQNETEIINAF